LLKYGANEKYSDHSSEKTGNKVSKSDHITSDKPLSIIFGLF